MDVVVAKELKIVVVSGVLGIFMWFNIDLTKYQKENRQRNQHDQESLV